MSGQQWADSVDVETDKAEYRPFSTVCASGALYPHWMHTLARINGERAVPMHCFVLARTAWIISEGIDTPTDMVIEIRSWLAGGDGRNPVSPGSGFFELGG